MGNGIDAMTTRIALSPAQSNHEEPVFETDGMKLTNIVEGTVDLRALQSEGKSDGLFTFELTDFPSTSKLTHNWPSCLIR